MRITIVDIAKKLEIHPSTVSLALRDSPKISSKTRQLIKETALEMNYQRNPYVSALMSAKQQGRLPKQSPTIAFITSSRSENSWQRMYNAKRFYAGCHESANHNEINLESFWIGENNMSGGRLNDILFNRGISGAVLLPTGRFRERMNYHWENIAAVSYGIYELKPEVDRLSTAHYGNMEKTLKKLVEAGFKRIGFAMDIPYPYANDNRWLAAYMVYQLQLPKDQKVIPWINSRPTKESFIDWYKLHNPDVVICINPNQVNEWLQDMGRSVPTDVSLASVGQSAKGSKFSGIYENSFHCGKLVIKFLLDRIYHNEFGITESPIHLTVRGKWNPGETLQIPKANKVVRVSSGG